MKCYDDLPTPYTDEALYEFTVGVAWTGEVLWKFWFQFQRSRSAESRQRGDGDEAERISRS